MALLAAPFSVQAATAEDAAAAAGKISFAVTCGFTHEKPDDPIVYPNTPGASHLHAFFGNRSTDAYSTTDSLRANPATACKVPQDASGYWVPALYDSGRKVDPSYARLYYHSGGKDHRTVQPVPRGLMILTKALSKVWWVCAGPDGTTKLMREIPKCSSGRHLVQVIHFPDCWDGLNVDSPDHFSHMSFNYSGQCPPARPVPIAQLRLNVHYKGSDGGAITLAPTSNPSKPHADFMNGWDQATLTKLTTRCINAGKECHVDETARIAAESP